MLVSAGEASEDRAAGQRNAALTHGPLVTTVEPKRRVTDKIVSSFSILTILFVDSVRAMNRPSVDTSVTASGR